MNATGVACNPFKAKRCRYCKTKFTPSRPLQTVCDWQCGHALVLQRKDKAQRKDTREKLEAIKPRAQWLREAQQAVNAFIRERDRDRPCISCDRHHQGQYHAGHYLSTGARPGLRFDERNIHKQCQPCNTHLSGNLVLYRAALIRKIGLGDVEAMESDHSVRKFTIDDLKAVKSTYKLKLKELKCLP